MKARLFIAECITNTLKNKIGSFSFDSMQNKSPITTLFLDIGGVLLSNGWDRAARKRAATTFSLDLPELEERHHLTFDTYEVGKLTLDEYLNRIVFYENRP